MSNIKYPSIKLKVLSFVYDDNKKLHPLKSDAYNKISSDKKDRFREDLCKMSDDCIVIIDINLIKSNIITLDNLDNVFIYEGNDNIYYKAVVESFKRNKNLLVVDPNLYTIFLKNHYLVYEESNIIINNDNIEPTDYIKLDSNDMTLFKLYSFDPYYKDLDLFVDKIYKNKCYDILFDFAYALINDYYYKCDYKYIKYYKSLNTKSDDFCDKVRPIGIALYLLICYTMRSQYLNNHLSGNYIVDLLNTSIFDKLVYESKAYSYASLLSTPLWISSKKYVKDTKSDFESMFRYKFLYKYTLEKYFKLVKALLHIDINTKVIKVIYKQFYTRVDEVDIEKSYEFDLKYDTRSILDYYDILYDIAKSKNLEIYFNRDSSILTIKI